MRGLYEQLVEAFDPDDAPVSAARRTLEILRHPDAAVLRSGVTAEAWQQAIEALLQSADAVDAAQRKHDADARRAAWTSIQRRLEEMGCRLWRLNSDGDQWRVEGPGVDLSIDVATGRVEGARYQTDDDTPVFDRLAKFVADDIASHKRSKAKADRLTELRRHYRWEVTQRVWVPKNGSGPSIPGGRNPPC